MGLVPETRVEKIQFFENHISTWTSNALEIGTTVSAVGALEALTTAARAALLAQGEAADAAKAATASYYAAVSAMAKTGGDIISAIRTYARTTNNEGVWDLAALPRPSQDSPIPAPGSPRDFVVTLNQTGFLTIKWKCTNPEGAAGTVYEVARRLTAGGPFVYIGVAGGDKTYTDQTLPAGSTGVAYRVTGLRSGLRGPTVQADVNFGISGGGGFTIASVVETETPEVQIAA